MKVFQSFSMMVFFSRPIASWVLSTPASSSSLTSIASRTITSSSTRLQAAANEEGLISGFFSGIKKTMARAAAGDYDEVATRAKLNALIADNNVLMLSFSTCPFCLKAKSVLDQKPGLKYEVVELDAVEGGMALRAEMANVIGRTSVPAIWIGQEFIGGCNDGPMGGIVTLNNSGKLDSMLQEAKAV